MADLPIVDLIVTRAISSIAELLVYQLYCILLRCVVVAIDGKLIYCIVLRSAATTLSENTQSVTIRNHENVWVAVVCYDASYTQ